MFRLWLLVVLTSWQAVAATSDQASPDSLRLDGAWVRALPPTQVNTAAYVDITNTSAETVQIVTASSDITDRVEMHSSVMVDGLMRMQQIDALSLAPGETVHFSPGGKHLMLFDVPSMPQPGQQVQLCIQAQNSTAVCTTAEVHKGNMPTDAHRHH